MLDQAQNIHLKLEGNLEWWGLPPRKPKGMHHKTYNRKIAKLKHLSRAANLSIMQHYSNDPDSMQIVQELFCELEE